MHSTSITIFVQSFRPHFPSFSFLRRSNLQREPCLQGQKPNQITAGFPGRVLGLRLLLASFVSFLLLRDRKPSKWRVSAEIWSSFGQLYFICRCKSRLLSVYKDFEITYPCLKEISLL